MQKFSDTELEVRMLKPPIRKITRWKIEAEFDFSRYNMLEDVKVEDTQLWKEEENDEIFHP